MGMVYFLFSSGFPEYQEISLEMEALITRFRNVQIFINQWTAKEG